MEECDTVKLASDATLAPGEILTIAKTFITTRMNPPTAESAKVIKDHGLMNIEGPTFDIGSGSSKTTKLTSNTEMTTTREDGITTTKKYTKTLIKPES